MTRLRSSTFAPEALRRVSPKPWPRRAVATAAFVVVGGASSLLACPVCFGAEESALIDGAKLGVAVLLAVTVAVQVGFVAFFLYLRKRMMRVAELELEDEWLALQRGSTTL